MEAIILAGGQSKRMGGDLPKPLVIARGLPIIGWQLRYLMSQGVDHVVVSVGYKAELIQDFLEDFAVTHPNLKIDVVVEDKPLGTGGGLKKAIDKVCDEKIHVMNCDDIMDVPLDELFALERSTIVAVNPILPFGQITVTGGYAQFVEKPVLKDVWANSGRYIFFTQDIKKIFEGMPDTFGLEEDIFPRMKLGVYYHRGLWHVMTTPKDVEAFGTIELPPMLKHLEI